MCVPLPVVPVEQGIGSVSGVAVVDFEPVVFPVGVEACCVVPHVELLCVAIVVASVVAPEQPPESGCWEPGSKGSHSSSVLELVVGCSPIQPFVDLSSSLTQGTPLGCFGCLG